MSQRFSVQGILATAIGIFALILLLPSTAFADREREIDATTTADGVRINASMLSSTYGTGGGQAGSMRLNLWRDGETALDFYPEPLCDYCGLYNGYDGYNGGVQILQLDSSPEPEIVFNIYWGGAHCCFYSLIFRYADGKYVPTRHVWGNRGYRLRNLAGKPRLVTRDDRFGYLFDAYAVSRYPLSIWSFQNGRMLDVTREYPNLIRKDAKGHKRRWLNTAPTGGAAAALAAWVADQCLLGHCSPALRKARVAAKNGAVDRFYPSGRRSFLRKLNRILVRFGYVR